MERVMTGKNERSRCSHSRSHQIYDEPYTFHVRSDRPLSHSQKNRKNRPCAACIQEANRLKFSGNVQHQKRCSRLPVTPADLERLNRPRTVPPPKRSSDDCNWDNFIKKKSKYAIKTPYALCGLTNNQQDFETRPPFINYGGRCNDKQHGQKRTFNSLAVHQLKHHEVDEQRLISLLRERHLRHQAEQYFRERKPCCGTEYEDNSRSAQDYHTHRH